MEYLMKISNVMTIYGNGWSIVVLTVGNSHKVICWI
jgi:hypothetical protein